jgi:hypothetical protein
MHTPSSSQISRGVGSGRPGFAFEDPSGVTNVGSAACRKKIRVTRLGEFSNVGRLFTLGQFFDKFLGYFYPW